MIYKYKGSADIYITEKCNESCIFCSAKKGELDVNIKDFQKYIQNWKNYGISHVNITGGEPLLNPCLDTLLEYAFKQKMDIALFTNGTLLNKKKLIKILPFVKWIAISIDGDSTGNIKVGRTASHLSTAIKSIENIRLLAPEIKIRIASVVSKINMKSVYKLGKIIIKRNVVPDLWRIKQVIPVRKAAECWETLKLTDIEYYQFVIKLQNSYGKYIKIKANPWQSKSKDLIVTYPDGSAGTTIINNNGNNAEVKSLGNIFEDFNNVIINWNKLINDNTRAADNYMREAWDKK